MRQKTSPPRRRPTSWAAPLAALVLLVAAHTVARAVPVAGLTASNKIILFDADSPGMLVSQTFVIGLRPGERLLGIDYRTSTAQLYALGSSRRLYTVDPVTGLATQVNSTPFSTQLEGVDVGIEFGIDFDPVTDRLRVVGETGQSFWLHPDTGEVILVDPRLVYAAGEPEAGQTPSVTAIAFTPNFKGAVSKTLYGLDWRRGTLVRIGPPASGAAEPPSGDTFTVGPLQTGFGVTELAGFDVAASDTIAYAAMRSTDALTSSRLYTVNLSTGAATQVGTIGGGEFVRDVTALSRPYDLYAVTASHKLLRISSATPGTAIDFFGIPALQSPSEKIVAIDCCPRGEETATIMTDASRFYNLNPTTFGLAFVGEILSANDRLQGTEFGFTFGPGVSRVVSNTGQNLRVNPSTGVGAHTQTPLAYAAGDPHAGQTPHVVATAFDQKGNASTMFDIDSGLDLLVRQGTAGGPDASHDSGQLFTVGPLGFDTDGSVGFDTDLGHFVNTCNPTALRDDGAFASLTAPGANESGLYSVSLRTGRATPLGTIAGGEVVRGIAVLPHAGLFHVQQGEVVNESDGSVTLTVTRTGDTGIEASLEFETFDLGSGANQSHDYTFASGTLRFKPGETSRTLKILITDDAHPEPSSGLGEPFFVRFQNPTNGFGIEHNTGVSGTPGVSAVFIEDDDSPSQDPIANPIDDSVFFVRQHYRDFFGRDPDAAGLNFWTNKIEACGANAQCREVQRIDTSAAFFLSIEFQNTGFLVHRLYRAAFARRPTYLEFMRGRQEAGSGIIVGEPGWQERLALSKRAYVARFATCANFKAVFDSKSNAEYVNDLFANAGVTPTQTERQALIDGLNNHTETRATVLLKVAENEAFARQETSPAFVVAEYFGYLRRDPDAGGFNFWLRKLNDHGGDFRRAEMVKAFITSFEYRRRFAP